MRLLALQQQSGLRAAPQRQASIPARLEPRRAMIALTIAVARREDVRPRLALLALALAESDFDPAAKNLKDLPWGSWGICQQKIDNADEYTGPASVPAVIALYQNPEYALPVAARKLKRWLEQGYNLADAMTKYNGPTLPPERNGNRAYYQSKAAEAARLFPSSELEGWTP